MQKQQDTWQLTEMEWKQPLSFPRIRLSILVVFIASTVILYANLLVPARGTTTLPPWHTALRKAIVTNGANHWNGDRTITAPTFDFSPPDTKDAVAVSSIFKDYYSSYGGASSLEAPVTAAFPIQQGWIQFFDAGALLLPAAQREPANNVGNPLNELIEAATTDSSPQRSLRSAFNPRGRIMQLPLLQALLTVGSQVPIDGNGSHFTYVDLRNATNPALMVPAPTPSHMGPSSIIWSHAVFIKGGIREGFDVGHLVPLPFWRYINRPDISPDGWQADFGDPLTEALPVAEVSDGSVHHLLIQAFWRVGLILDRNSLDASGLPQIQRLDTGVAYLRTFGPPPVRIRSQQTIWTTRCSGAPCGYRALLDAPGTGQPVVHVGQSFPLMLLGNTTWTPTINAKFPTINRGTTMLWYHVEWNGPKGPDTGWVAASAISFTLPKNVPAQASFDLLSPDLASYLAQVGNNVNAVVYDVTHQRYYTYNANAQFITGSSMKVAILLTFLNMMETEAREPDDDEMNLLTTMIENSDNDSASALYYGKIGGATGVASYLHSIGVRGLDPDGDSWGYSLITPMAMVNLLTLLYQGKILTQQDRQLALNLMENIESDQQVGVGDTVPQDATVAMKDGWLPGPDGLWAFNSSGIVTLGQQTYIIAVYTQEQNSLDDGQAIVRHVCAAVASSLIAGGELKVG